MSETLRLRTIAVMVLVAVGGIGFVAGRQTAETPRVERPTLYIDPGTGCHFLVMNGQLHERPDRDGSQICGDAWPTMDRL